MFKNEIIKASYKEVQTILKSFMEDIHVVEIDGKHIQSWEDYILEIETKMRFPTTCIDSIDRYLDWITDLEWLGKNSYVLIIYNFADFMENNPDIKNLIIKRFKEHILPWWQEDVEEFSAGGKRKPFNVYLVD